MADLDARYGASVRRQLTDGERRREERQERRDRQEDRRERE